MNVKDLQILALKAVELPDDDSAYRSICRWFSREFHTPLEYVENDLDQSYVLRHYYEHHYSQIIEAPGEEAQFRYMSLRNEILNDGADPEQKVKEAEDDEWEKQMLLELEAAEAKKQLQATKKTAKKATVKEPNLEDDFSVTKLGE